MFKIKFLDTGEELEVTEAAQLANTKVRVSSPEESWQIQQAAFKLGFYWMGYKGNSPNFIDEPFLSFNKNFALGFWQDEETFEINPKREVVFLPSQPQQIQRGETGQRGEITPEALEAEGWERFLGPYTHQYTKGEIAAEFCKDGIIIWVDDTEAKNCKTMPDLRTLDRLVNGVAIPSTTNN